MERSPEVSGWVQTISYEPARKKLVTIQNREGFQDVATMSGFAKTVSRASERQTIGNASV